MRVQQGRVFADTVNGLGASAVPMPWGEVMPAAQQGVIDGADLPIVNINALKVYEVSKYVSMTFHNYGPTVARDEPGRLEEPHPPTSRSSSWTSAGRPRRRSARPTESVDNLAKAKEILEAKGMKVNAADVASFRKLAEDKIWPRLQAAVRRDVGQDGQRQVAVSATLRPSGASPALPERRRTFID